MACAAALATLDVIEKQGLVERSARLGARLLNRLAPLAEADHIVDVRGQGLTLVVETDSADRATSLRAHAQRDGLLLRQHAQTIMAVPPLMIDESGVDEIADCIGALVMNVKRRGLL